MVGPFSDSDCAMMIQVRWQPSDLSIPEINPLSPAVTLATKSGGDTGTPPVDRPSPPDPMDTRSTAPPPSNGNGNGNGNGSRSRGDGLTPGVVTAITASMVAALAVALASWLFIKYRRRGLELRRGRRSAKDAGGGRDTLRSSWKAEFPCDTEMSPRPPPEPVNELPDHMAAQAHTLDTYPSETDGEGIRR